MPNPDPLDQPDDDTAYALVMPFVVCQSQGGTYDDEAFVAGYQAGRLDRALAVAAVNDTPTVRATVAAQLVPQLDLIGMHHGYPVCEVTIDDDHPTWADVQFRRESTDG